MLKTVILWPAIAQAVLIFLAYVNLGRARSAAVRNGLAKDTDFPPGNEPPQSAAGRRLVANQFELPVLFFVVIGFLMMIDGVSIIELALAWVFVIFRALQMIGSLKGPLMLRHASFFAAFLIVVALWADLAIRLI
ncbi:MAPEG family protein [Mesorhizobium sp. BR1-1-16]|uniref:MAPEG family protein n=1 Tax=Mesorhizobium sp. BR1-1-16 TaxID=2876653 RepID=UPI001CCE8F1D|nr:MAPEG family protein [Mesorhizobium sp. BR1-1-16]MBZ9935541.1 MAPEG family protein [Mesorhizobium sp. BR1-1-16]